MILREASSRMKSSFETAFKKWVRSQYLLRRPKHPGADGATQGVIESEDEMLRSYVGDSELKGFDLWIAAARKAGLDAPDEPQGHKKVSRKKERRRRKRRVLKL